MFVAGAWSVFKLRAVSAVNIVHRHTVFFPTVDPPASIAITDPGFLGYVSIHWTQPAGLQNLTGCTVRYQLRYYDTYEERWRVRILENSQNTPHTVSFVLLSAHKHLYVSVFFTSCMPHSEMFWNNYAIKNSKLILWSFLWNCSGTTLLKLCSFLLDKPALVFHHFCGSLSCFFLKFCTYYTLSALI